MGTLDKLYNDFLYVCNQAPKGINCSDKEYKVQDRRESIAYNKFMRECDRLGLSHIDEASKRLNPTVSL